MSANATTKLLEDITGNRLASSLVALTTLIAGLVTVSAPLLILSGVFAYGWPFLHVYLASINDAATEAAKPARKGLTSIPAGALAAR